MAAERLRRLLQESGGFNGRGQTVVSATTPYDPETVDAYEVGFKSEFFDRRLSLNMAAFYTDYQDIQQSTTVTLAGGIASRWATNCLAVPGICIGPQISQRPSLTSATQFTGSMQACARNGT